MTIVQLMSAPVRQALTKELGQGRFPLRFSHREQELHPPRNEQIRKAMRDGPRGHDTEHGFFVLVRIDRAHPANGINQPFEGLAASCGQFRRLMIRPARREHQPEQRRVSQRKIDVSKPGCDQLGHAVRRRNFLSSLLRGDKTPVALRRQPSEQSVRIPEVMGGSRMTHAGALGNTAQRETLDTLILQLSLRCLQQSGSQVAVVIGLGAADRISPRACHGHGHLDSVKSHLDIGKIEIYKPVCDSVKIVKATRMTLDALFQLCTTATMAGWLVLLASPIAPALADRVSGLLIPTLLAILYAGLVMAFWTQAQGARRVASTSRSSSSCPVSCSRSCLDRQVISPLAA
jgi:hypothetical protein